MFLKYLLCVKTLCQILGEEEVVCSSVKICMDPSPEELKGKKGDGTSVFVIMALGGNWEFSRRAQGRETDRIELLPAG